MEVKGSSKKMIATQSDMVENQVPIPYRDQSPHPTQQCEYEHFMERMLQMQKIREEEAMFKQPGKQGASIPLVPKTAHA
ncbi:short-chain dehydrogenase reductase 2a-like [Hibiscus syriacus]|uniref:Short-chain dehydrogenase reductase 2a-like n=1 Tax=Hibiscus syriacus TaxID=106335 RepID=A0A6A3BRR7_HIBSY|nr:short-chain dehydrogenase reductase 2a-like [Hibiscus syriacus]